MTYEMYRYLFIGGAALSVLMLAVSVVLFFVLNIPHVIGDLTGSNARKAIEQIRSQNEGSGIKTYKSSHVNRERGRVTDKITATGRLTPVQSAEGAAMRTEKFETELLIQQAQEAQQYTYTSGESGECFPGNETTLLAQQSSSMYGQTVLLEKDEDQFFEIEFEISFIHSNTVIA